MSSELCGTTCTGQSQFRPRQQHGRRPAYQLALLDERFRGVLATHDDFEQLNLLRLGKLGVGEDLFEFAAGRSQQRLGLFRRVVPVERVEQLAPLPGRNVVVPGFFAVDLALDDLSTDEQGVRLGGQVRASKGGRTHVSVVVEHDEDRLEVQADHGRHFLRRQLKTTLSGEDDHTPRLGRLFRRQQRSERRATRPTDTAPQDLRDERRALWQRRADHAERRGPRLGDDNVVFAEELAHHRPERGLRHHLVLRTVGDVHLEALGRRRLRELIFALEDLGEGGKELVERDVRIGRILNERVVRVTADCKETCVSDCSAGGRTDPSHSSMTFFWSNGYENSPVLKSDLREPTCAARKRVQFAEYLRSSAVKEDGRLAAYHEGKVRLFDQLLHVGVSDSADVDAAEPVVRVLVDRGPTHRGRVEPDTGRLDQVADEVTDAVPDRARVDEHDGLLGLAPEPRDLVDDKLEALLLLFFDFLAGRQHVLVVESDSVGDDRGLEALLVDRSEDEVGRERDVRRSGRAQSFKDDAVDLGSGVLGPLQECASTCDTL